MRELTLIKIENLNVSYSNKTVFEKLNLLIDNFNFLGIVGANGCGKTTLLKVISQNLKPNKGNIYFNNTDLNSIKKKQLSKFRAYVSASENIVDEYLSVNQYLGFGRSPYSDIWGNLTQNDKNIIYKWVKKSEIDYLLGKKINQLSSGEKQKIQIIRALIQEPKIILLDEPTSHLDIKHQISIMKLLKEVSNNDNKVIAIIHDLNLASYFCDKLLLLQKNDSFNYGNPEEILTNKNLNKSFGNDWEIEKRNNLIRVFPKINN